jgi:hypothetical protein
VARDLTAAILEDCGDDWYGLWEIYANVAERMGSSPASAWSTNIDIDPNFGSELRTELADLIEDERRRTLDGWQRNLVPGHPAV